MEEKRIKTQNTGVKHRLLEYLRYRRMSQREFAQSLGASDSYINSMRNAPSQQRLEMIAQIYPDLNITWLLTGQDNMLNTDAPTLSITQTAHHNTAPVNQQATVQPYQSHQTENAKPLLPPQFVRQPNIDVYAGIMSGAIDTIEQGQIEQVSDYDFTYTIIDNTMAPRIIAGDLVALRNLGPEPHIIDGMTYGIDTGPTGLLLRHVTDGGDHYILRANNPDVPESTIPKTAVLRIFQFCGFLGYTSL